jgi:hypothetical protein
MIEEYGIEYGTGIFFYPHSKARYELMAVPCYSAFGA